MNEVERRSFSGTVAAASGKTVLYVTERCVFRLCTEGLALIEIAPGVDLQREILDRMEFVPVMHQPPALMDPPSSAVIPWACDRNCLRCRWSSAWVTTPGKTCSS
ncbi:MAG: hypothetical protein HZA62_08400 [Rhodocyclales bacterium]|nr:hypothetical protein [Rhodocyclales bacterium]